MTHRGPLPAPEQLARFYDADHAGKWQYIESQSSAWTVAGGMLEGHARGADRYSVLDFGAGEGGFLASLPGYWQRMACEPSAARRQRLEGAGFKAVASIDELEFSQPRFNAICMFDVFEHVLNPTELIVRLSRLLLPGGVIVLSTADGNSLPFRLLRGDHWYFRTPLHLILASEPYFRWFAATARADLQAVVRCGHQGFSLLSWVDDALSVAHWLAMRRGGVARIAQRLIQGLPRYRQLRHRKLSPHCPRLRDHMVVRLGNFAATTNFQR